MSYSMPLNELLSAISIEIDDQVIVEDLKLDSRSVKQGALFLAYPGTAMDGRNFIQKAQESGAVAVLYEAADFSLPDDITIPAYAVNDLREKVGLLAHHFFAEPSSEIQVFGVTGTNGKTTNCYLLTQALTKLGMRAAMIGTIGVGELHSLIGSGHTTPSPISIHRLLAQWRDEGITQVCMEVTSHALDQGRVAGVQFFCTMFTNLSHDHLDYHGDMERYAAAKQKLFTDYPAELVITNADDPIGLGLIDIANSDFIASYGESSGDVRLEEVKFNEQGMTLMIEAGEVDFSVTTSLVGKINLPNVLMLVTTLLSLSTSVEDIKRIVTMLDAVPGRMEMYHAADKAHVVIDYAHTPDALERALQSISEHCSGLLWCVFGCGGDRDKGKRPLMGEIASRLADRVIITNDNPRSESPTEIAADIKVGTGSMCLVELDRAEAISAAISQAGSDDWVLVAGKGHETIQFIDDRVFEFSDREHVLKNLGVVA